MEKITIQKKTLILHPLKIRQLTQLEAFIKDFSAGIDMAPDSEMSIMGALAKIAEQGLLGEMAKILFPGQEAVAKIKWDDLEINEIAKVGESFLSVNAPAMDALKRILISSGLAEIAPK